MVSTKGRDEALPNVLPTRTESSWLSVSVSLYELNVICILCQKNDGENVVMSVDRWCDNILFENVVYRNSIASSLIKCGFMYRDTLMHRIAVPGI